jgi:hypothetical protein
MGKYRTRQVFIIIVASVLLLSISSIFTLHVWIRQDVKKNISIAQKKYPGTAEDALISFLLDENNSFQERTHIAIWTLGQLKSRKALPILRYYYKDDPKGLTCHGKHDQMLCQYGLHKAILQIESDWYYSNSGLNR